MGRTIRDEDLRLNIVVNGNKAQKEIGELENQTRELRETNKSLRLEKAKLNKEDKEYEANLKKLNLAIKENNSAITTNENRMKELRREIGINAMTSRQLRQEYNRLKYQLSNLTPGTAEWKRVNAEMQKYGTRLNQVSTGANKTGTSIGKLADKFNRFIGIGTAFIATLTGMVFSMKEWIKGLAGMDDALANVMKTTGLTRKEVRELYTDFKYLNTRTARKELLLLAEQAGRLGIKGKKDIMDFVEVANQIKVALGDDLGGDAEVAIREVGKLTNIYKVGEKYGTNFRDSMLMVGSAINEVSANSQAQAPFLIETLKRLGGIAEQADISAQNVIGYASALDQLGQRQETSATAMSKVIINMFKDVDTYAGIAKMTSEDFLKLLQTDANEAFLKFLEGLNGNNEGLTVMSQKLDGLGLDGSRAVQVLASLSSHTQLVREQQDLANKSLEEGTSLTTEYNVKNNNMAGNLDKIGRALHAAFINSKVNAALEGIVGKVAKWFEYDLSEKMKDEQKEVNLLVIEMTNANTTAERRNEIYETLKDISPDIVAGIDAENISVEKLSTNLARYNEEMIKKIALQESDEDLAEQREALGSKIGQKIKTENKLSEELFKLKEKTKKYDETAAQKIDEILLSKSDIIDKEIQIRKIVEEVNKAQGLNYLNATLAYNEAYKVKELREDELKLQEEFNRSFEEYRKMYDSIIGPPGGGSDGGGGDGDEPDGTDKENNLKVLKQELEQTSQLEINSLKEKRIAQLITEQQYREQLQELELAHLLAMKILMEQYGQDVTEIQGRILDAQIAAINSQRAEKQVSIVHMTDMEKQYSSDINAMMDADMQEWIANLNEKLNKEKQVMQEQTQLAMQFSGDLANLIGSAIDGQADAAKNFSKYLLQLTLDSLRKFAHAAVAKATFQSLASAESVATWGIAGLAKAAGLTALIEGVYAAASALINSGNTPQYVSGNYLDVIGAQDGRKYRAGVRSGTGSYGSPTFIPGLGLVGERGKELVFSAPDTQKLLNTPGLINAINQTLGVRQFASGNAREIIRESSTIEKSFTDPELLNALNRLNENLESGIQAEVIANEDYIDTHNKVMKKYNVFKSKVNG